MSEPEKILPTWTSYVPRQEQGIDLLGVTGPGDRMNRLLLPALTGGTNHPRYFSFLTWITDRFHKQKEISKVSKFKEYLNVYESLFVASCLFHHREKNDLRGIIGRRSVKKVDWDGLREISLDEIRGGSETSAWDAVNYKPSTAALKLVGYSSGSDPSLVRGIGERVADGFEASLGPEIISRLNDLDRASKKSVSIEFVSLFASKACLCCSGMSDKERVALADAIVLAEHVDSSRPGVLEQSKTFGLLLDLISKIPVLSDSDWCEENILRAVSGANAPISPERPFLETFHGWRLQLMRSLQRFALESIWNGFHSHLKGTYFLPSDVESFAKFCEQNWLKGISSEGRVALKALCFESPRTISEILQVLERTQVRSAADILRFPFSREAVNELDIALLISEAMEDGNWALTVNIGVLLLVGVEFRIRSLANGKSSTEAEFLNLGGTTNLGMRLLGKKLTERSILPWDQLLKLHFEEWVIGQHLKTASRKLRTQGTDTYRIRMEEKGYMCFGNVRFPPTEAVYSRMFSSAVSILRELGLISLADMQPPMVAEYLGESPNQADFVSSSVFKVTELGRTYLGKIIASSENKLPTAQT